VTGRYAERTREISSAVGEIRKGVPDVMKAFGSLAKSATTDGVLDAKTKELVALAIGIATHCDGCIAFHTKTLAKLGAPREEVMEILGVAVYMGGGPSLMYAAEAIRAYDEFAGAG